MLFAPGDQFCGVRAEVAREAARIVESVQRCSAGFLARELGMDTVASCRLLKALEDDGRLVRYEGMLPPGHDGAWLPEEEAGGELLVLWHLTYPEGKALAKSRIGHAVPRGQAEALLTQVLDRVCAVNDDPAGSHIIECATHFGSLTDPARHEVGDVDLTVYARRRNRGTGPVPGIRRARRPRDRRRRDAAVRRGGRQPEEEPGSVPAGRGRASRCQRGR